MENRSHILHFLTLMKLRQEEGEMLVNFFEFNLGTNVCYTFITGAPLSGLNQSCSVWSCSNV